MDRREFIINGASFLLGSLFGFNPFSKALAGECNSKCKLHEPRLSLIVDDNFDKFIESEKDIEFIQKKALKARRVWHSHDFRCSAQVSQIRRPGLGVS